MLQQDALEGGHYAAVLMTIAERFNGLALDLFVVMFPDDARQGIDRGGSPRICTGSLRLRSHARLCIAFCSDTA